MERGAWRATVHAVTKSWTQLSDLVHGHCGEQYGGSLTTLFSTPSPAFIICRLLDRSHSDWCEMVPHSGFDLHFSDNE